MKRFMNNRQPFSRTNAMLSVGSSLKNTYKETKYNRKLKGDIFNLIIITGFAIIMAIPLLYVIANAFKPLEELYLFPPRFFVENPTLDNIKGLFTLMGNSWVPLTRYFFNTIFITAIGTAGHVIFASLAAYVLEKHKFYGQKLFFSLIIMTLMFSSTVTSIPNFIIMSKIGWVDTYLSVIVPAMGAPLGLFLMKQFMTTVPDTLLEAAKIDGASELRIFTIIVMPIVKPAWLTLIIFSTQSLWNTTGGIFIRSEQLKPLPYALNQIMTGGLARAGQGSAVAFLLMTVPIFIFIISQKNIINTMSTSGLKE